ncbi:MAG TPA: rRNA maturation RNase YbeY [Acidobacteriota bacterium]|nr:rRNA maturation RNase YbeY [Acidobacteriota bacterium]
MKDAGPKVNVFNRQRRLPVDTHSLRKFLGQLVRRLKIQQGFSVVLISDSKMIQYQKRFRQKDSPTDVLSFPADDEGESYLGDILISIETAARQASGSLTQELQLLSLHGLLHLLGYDHEADQGEMARLEGQLRRELNLPSS